MNAGRVQLASSLAILAALAGALALSGPGGGPAAEATSAADRAELDPDQLTRISVALTAPTARRVERVRELKFDRLPKPEVVSSGFLNRLGARELAREGGGGLGIAADDAVGAITGQLAPDEDLHSAYESTGDLSAAAYDPRTKRLYVVSDAVVANRALVEFVLAHELDHALEDQNFGLGGAGPANDDAALARQAMMEGSATDLMIEYARDYLDPLQLLAATQTIDAGTGDVPRAYVDQLTWTYLGGRRFIDSLRRTSGDWKLIDYAFGDRPPRTTEQVLHPRKFLSDELPRPIDIDPEPLRAAGWRLADRNTFGELATDHLLAVGAATDRARAAAAGWDGDRYELWRRDLPPAKCAYPCRADLALVAKWAFDSAPDAREFDGAMDDYLREGLDGEELDGGGWRLDGGFAAVASAGDVSALAFAPTEHLARAAAQAQAP